MIFDLRDYPCHTCVSPKRSPGCHGKCKEFQARKKQDEARLKRQRAETTAYEKYVK